MVDEPWSGKPGAGDRNRTGTGLSALRIFLPATAFAAATRRLWSGLSLHHGVAAVGAARLVSTPSCFQAWLGITSEGFPDFEQFCILGFPGSTQVGLSPLRLPISPRPRAMTFITRAGLVAKVSGERFYVGCSLFGSGVSLGFQMRWLCRRGHFRRGVSFVRLGTRLTLMSAVLNWFLM